MTPALHNPILAVNAAGYATPLGVAAERAGWAWLENPTPRELLRAVFCRAHAVVVVGFGPSDGAFGTDTTAACLLRSLHRSSQVGHVVAAGFRTGVADEREVLACGISLYLHDADPGRLITAAQSLLPQRAPLLSTAPINDNHPTLHDPTLAPRAHLRSMRPHPPPVRAGPSSRSAPL